MEDDLVGGGNLTFDTRKETLKFLADLFDSLNPHEYINVEIQEFTTEIRLTWEIWK